MTAAKTRSLNAAPPRRLEHPGRSRPGRPGYDLESLLAVAVEVFNERGYDGTSMEDLSARLGIAKSAIYHQVADEVQRTGGPAVARLELLVRESVELLQRELPYVTLLLRVRGNTQVE